MVVMDIDFDAIASPWDLPVPAGLVARHPLAEWLIDLQRAIARRTLVMPETFAAVFGGRIAYALPADLLAEHDDSQASVAVLRLGGHQPPPADVLDDSGVAITLSPRLAPTPIAARA